jgi:hypothetical protein
LYLDEIHEVENWEFFIQRVLEQENCHIFISGSSAKLLSKEIASQLRGRSITCEIFPFSFPEYCKNFNITLHPHLSTKEQNKVHHYQAQFLLMGGFPETVNMDEALHREVLQNYL